MRKYIYIYLFLILAVSLSLPFLAFGIQDIYTLHNSVSISNSETQETLKKHPIITSIYQKQYNFDQNTLSPVEYSLSNTASYSKEKNAEIEVLKKQFNKEINELIQNKVLSPHLLEITPEQNYTISFGTLTLYPNKDANLDQIYRMWENKNFKSIEYSMDNTTKKIIDIQITQQKKLSYSEKQLQEIALHMIHYLELDDIDDWAYYQSGYESNKAKLRVNSGIEYNGETYTFYINVQILGIQRYIPSNQNAYIIRK